MQGPAEACNDNTVLKRVLHQSRITDHRFILCHNFLWPEKPLRVMSLHCEKRSDGSPWVNGDLADGKRLQYPRSPVVPGWQRYGAGHASAGYQCWHPDKYGQRLHADMPEGGHCRLVVEKCKFCWASGPAGTGQLQWLEVQVGRWKGVRTLYQAVWVDAYPGASTPISGYIPHQYASPYKEQAI